MVGEGTTAITITFLLAIIGYVGLTVVLLRSLQGRMPWVLWRTVAVVIATHVVMVWTFRYHGEFALAVRNGYGGFLLFHTALTLILISTFLRERLAILLVRVAFLIVTAGALGASFIYDVVAIYRVPVILCAVAGVGALIWHFFRPHGPT